MDVLTGALDMVTGTVDITWTTAVTVGLGAIVLYLLYKLTKGSDCYWEKRGVTEMKSNLFKTLKILMLSRKSLTDYIMDIYKEYHDKKYVGYTFLGKRTLMVHDPEIINQILIKDFSYFQDRSKILEGETEILNDGLATLTGEKWRILRHKLMPTFSSGKMKAMFNQIRDCCDEFVLYVKENKGKDLETRDFLFKYMINVVGNTAFSMKIDSFHEDNEFLRMSRNFFSPRLKNQLKFWFAAFFPKLKTLLKIRVIDTEVNDFFLNLTENLIKQRLQNGERRNDFLQLMLDQRDKELALHNNVTTNQEGNKVSLDNENIEADELELSEYFKDTKYDKDSLVFTDACIAAQTFLFISGGSETTSSVLSFALHELAVNQDVQRKLQKEIDSVVSTQGFTYESIKKMTYLEQVLNEVLRLRPPGSVLVRMCVQDYKMPGTDLIIEKETMIQVPSIGLHKDAQYFANPEKFDPDHFQDIDSIPKGVFLPFGGGPRMCIAMRLAMLQMKVFLVTVLSSYNILHSDKTPIPLQMDKLSTLQHVKGGLWVKFEPRM